MATAKKQTKQTFMAHINLDLDIGVEIEADSLAEAIEKANALKTHEVVNFTMNGWEHMDSRPMEVTGIWKNE